MSADLALPPRAEIYRDVIASTQFGVVEKPLSAWERLYNVSALRKAVILIALALMWEGYARWLDNPLLFPAFGATVGAFLRGIADGSLPVKAWTSLQVLLIGYTCGIACAAALTVIAISSRIGTDLLETLT